ncbi:MAG: dTDP-glucose 4,6-dehydratase [Actinomycetota bacterium]
MSGVRSVLVTGGAGFIGSHVVDLLMLDPDTRVTVLDRLSTGGSRANLEDHDADERFTFVEGDVRDAAAVRPFVERTDAVIHAAAESHVDRSVDTPLDFVETNVLGTATVLDACRETNTRMLMLSTDEVYGQGSPGGAFSEEDALRPRSPYAASKAGADLLCGAYAATYGVPVTVVRGTNAYGPRQIERVVPTYALAALEGRPVPVYADGRERREFLHVRDWVRAALLVLDRGVPGETYNVGGGFELENVELARRICALAGADESAITFVADRPGHDFRYGLDNRKLEALGWRPEISFDHGLAETVAWYRSHGDWLRGAHDVPVVTEPRAVGA